MKKIILLGLTILALVAVFTGSAFAYTTINGSEAYEIFTSNPELVVVDVRENYEFCPSHIECALNYPYNSGIFAEEYAALPTTSPILLVCASGGRSSRAAATMSANGFTDVYSLSGGIGSWTGELFSCADTEACTPTFKFYFPHIASGSGWETEIAIINTSPDTTLHGTFKGYDAEGNLIEESEPLTLPGAGRQELKIGASFNHASAIAYIIFQSDSENVYGYLKFYNFPGESYRVAIPAPNRINEHDILVSHIALEDGWWTGIALVNTTPEEKTLTFTFNHGESRPLTIGAGSHLSTTIAQILGDLPPTDISSAVISNAEGIIGLEIFGRASQLSGVLLRDETTRTLYFPHIASDNEWWTGIAAFNPGLTAGELAIKAYAEDGSLLTPAAAATPIEDALINPAADATPIAIGSRKQFIRAASQLDLPLTTAWLEIEASVPVSGFELFGSSDDLKLAGYTSVNLEGSSGLFPKLEKQGWSGIALINTTADNISVTLTAYRDDGFPVATHEWSLAGHQRLIDQPENLFSEEIDTATYISYQASGSVVAFQLNNSGNMLDALPGR